jgi:hypothetical protein
MAGRSTRNVPRHKMLGDTANARGHCRKVAGERGSKPVLEPQVLSFASLPSSSSRPQAVLGRQGKNLATRQSAVSPLARRPRPRCRAKRSAASCRSDGIDRGGEPANPLSSHSRIDEEEFDLSVDHGCGNLQSAVTTNVVSLRPSDRCHEQALFTNHRRGVGRHASRLAP